MLIKSGAIRFEGYAFPYGYIAEIDLATITDRMAVKQAVQSGDVEVAIERVNDLNPEVGCVQLKLGGYLKT